METKQIAAIAMVVVVIIAAIGAYYLVSQDSGGSDDKMEVASSLTIGGNVNNDYTIDERDAELLQSILDGADSSDYPLADVNGDNKIDENDMEMLNSIIAGTNDEIMVVDADGRKVVCEYPLKNVVTINADMLSIVTALQARESLAGFVASCYDNEQAYIREDTSIADLGDGRYIEEAGYVKLRDISSQLSQQGENIGAILYMTDEALGDYRDDFVAAGIPLIKVLCTGPQESADAYMTLGYLFGGDCVDRGVELNVYANEVYDHINKTIGDREKTTCLSFTMWRYITQTESQYTQLTEFAGGNNITTNVGDGSDKLNTPEAITQYDNQAEYMISFRSIDIAIEDPITLFENKNVQTYLSPSANFENLVFVNSNLPVCIRVAYVAEILYPDLFEGYADQVFQEFVDLFLPYLNEFAEDGSFDVTTDVTTVITYADYEAAKAAVV